MGFYTSLFLLLTFISISSTTNESSSLEPTLYNCKTSPEMEIAHGIIYISNTMPENEVYCEEESSLPEMYIQFYKFITSNPKRIKLDNLLDILYEIRCNKHSDIHYVEDIMNGITWTDTINTLLSNLI